MSAREQSLALILFLLLLILDQFNICPQSWLLLLFQFFIKGGENGRIK